MGPYGVVALPLSIPSVGCELFLLGSPHHYCQQLLLWRNQMSSRLSLQKQIFILVTTTGFWGSNFQDSNLWWNESMECWLLWSSQRWEASIPQEALLSCWRVTHVQFWDARSQILQLTLTSHRWAIISGKKDKTFGKSGFLLADVHFQSVSKLECLKQVGVADHSHWFINKVCYPLESPRAETLLWLFWASRLMGRNDS